MHTHINAKLHAEFFSLNRSTAAIVMFMNLSIVRVISLDLLKNSEKWSRVISVKSSHSDSTTVCKRRQCSVISAIAVHGVKQIKSFKGWAQTGYDSHTVIIQIIALS